MKYIDSPLGEFVDINKEENMQNSVDVIMCTLDAEHSLEKCLFSLYSEVPVSRLLVCDGGSKDETVNILKKFPRVELHVKPEIKTTGKAVEFLISLVETEWFVALDGDLELARGWYNEMRKHQGEFDAIENSRMILAYHMYRELLAKLGELSRPQGLCHLVKRNSVENYHCDDDYMWRFTDYFFRQAIEESGFRYGKVDSTFFVHHETERQLYKSDSEKNYQEIVWEKPHKVVLDKEKEKIWSEKHGKAVVKYLDPENPCVKNNKHWGKVINILDRDWIKQNGPKWLEIYDEQSNLKNTYKGIGRKLLRK